MEIKTNQNDDPESNDDTFFDVRAGRDLPESLTIDVTLPEQVRAAPADERAVSIDDRTVRAGHLMDNPQSTTSISLIPVIPDPVESQEEARIKRNRLRGAITDDPETASMLTADRLLEYRSRKRRFLLYHIRQLKFGKLCS